MSMTIMVPQALDQVLHEMREDAIAKAVTALAEKYKFDVEEATSFLKPVDKYDIAVWSNQGDHVAFAKQLRTKVNVDMYRYPGEETTDIGERLEVKYQCGDAQNVRILNDIATEENNSGKSGVFIIKQKKNWIRIGRIIKRQTMDNHPETGQMMMLLTIQPDKLILKGNKRDALHYMDHHVKQTGRGTGTFNRGVCRIKN